MLDVLSNGPDMRTCVIDNPAAGRGRAGKLLEAAKTKLSRHYTYRSTSAPKHAIELAYRAVEEGFDRIIAAGGDGTAHEVAQGILESGNRDVVFSTWPVGSSNDYARCIGLGGWWKNPESEALAILTVDVGRLTFGDESHWFINGLGIGFNGMVTVEAHKIGLLRGPLLYVTAFLQAFRKHYRTPTMKFRFNDEAEVEHPTLSLTANCGQREGGFPVTWTAKLDDGRFDLFHPRALRRWELIRYLPALLNGNLPKDHPQLTTRQANRIRVECDTPFCIHIDGELAAVPEDRVKTATVELVPARLRVEVCPKFLYEGRT